MPGLSDYQFQAPGAGPGGSGGGSRWPRGALIIGIVAVVAAGGYVLYRRGGISPAPTQPAAAAKAPAPERPLAEGAERYDLPPLEDSDEFVRQRLRPLSSHPLFVAWLRTNGLVRNFVVVVENTARGLTPSKHLRVLKPAGTFRVVKRGNQVLIDPRNYDRFSRIADLAASIDPGAAAKIYGGFKPLLQTAYDELGNQEPIDRAMERAIVGLLQAPVVDGDVRVQMAGEGIGYQFSDAKLEALTGAQKQLVRMGPRNMRVIQDRLRLFGLALGIPAQRLSRF